MQHIALITATPMESEEIRHCIHPEVKEDLKIVFEGKLHGKEIIFTHSGVGKVNAAHSATLLLENYDIDLMILFGIGGAYPHSNLRIGDIAVAESENYGEEGVLTPEGWHPMEYTGLALLKNEREYYNRFPLHKEMSMFAVKTLKDSGFKVIWGNFVTVSQCSGTLQAGEILRKRFNAICENTEGAAVAHLCTLYKTPLIEIRGISNIIEDRRNWNIAMASSICNRAVIKLIEKL